MHDGGERPNPGEPPETIDPTDPTDPVSGDAPDTAHPPDAARALDAADAPDLAPAPEAAPGAPNAPAAFAAVLSADLRAAWLKLDPSAQMLAAASAGVLLLTLLGLPFGVWDSAQFVMIVVVASLVTGATAWVGGTPAARSLPVPLSTIELGAGLVLASLAGLKLLEILFDIDDLGGAGGIFGLVIAVALVGAAGALVRSVIQRGADPLGSIRSDDRGALIAVAGFALVMGGWALNVSFSFWTLAQAALPVAVLAIAALTVVEAPRIPSPIPVAWVGAAIAVFGAILAVAHWGDLTSLGQTELVLDPFDFLGLLGYSVGAGLIIVGGVLSGAATLPADPSADDPAGRS